MDLRLYLDIFKRHALVIVIVAAMALAVMATVGFLRPPVYTSYTTVRIMLDVGVADFKIWGDQAQRLLNTYGHVLESGPTLQEAIDRLAPRTSTLTVGELRDRVKTEVVPTTELISISVEDGDPALAQDLANTLATLLTEYAQNLYVGSSKSTFQIVQEQLISLERDIETNRQQLEALLAKGEFSTEIEALRTEIELQEDAYDRLLQRYELAQLNESLRANSVTVIAPATLPLRPSNGFGLTEIGIALIVGVFSGITLALVLENVDTRIHSPEQLERLTGLPVLGTAPTGLASPDSFGGVVSTNGSQPVEEAYRLLGMTLQMLKGQNALQTILVTSALPKEGKSIVSANLARALAERGQTVFLVESDLRRPTLTKMLDIADGNGGLSDLLAEPSALSHESLGRVVHPAKQNALFVIGGGQKIANPTSSLASPAMESLLDYLGAEGQMTLVDAPPVLGLADVSVLVPRVDGVILVVRQAYSKRERLLSALKQLERCQASVLGFVFLQKNDKDWVY